MQSPWLVTPKHPLPSELQACNGIFDGALYLTAGGLTGGPANEYPWHKMVATSAIERNSSFFRMLVTLDSFNVLSQSDIHVNHPSG
jgi:hypothetical protein